MTEMILDYDRSIVPQETGWFCGPASTQVVLNNKGKKVSEQDLAKEMGTHTGGTNSINLIVPSLRKYSGVAEYTFREMPNDPPTDKQKEQLWKDVVGSLNSGHGVVANIVAPVTNYPQGVKGSKSPYYAGGTVYHYIALMGFDDTPGARAIWVADSGFQPQGYWISFDQLAGLIPPKGYAYVPGVMPDAPPAPPVLPAPTNLTADVLSAAMGGRLSIARYAELLPGFAQAMVQAGCTNVNRAAMWCAQIGHESAGLYNMEEIASGADYEGRGDLGNVVTGDGRRFKGRGPIQVTGRHNYAELSKWAHSKGYVPTPTFFVDNPTALAEPRYGFLGAVWYWTVSRPTINQHSDAKDLRRVTQLINGGYNGLDDRQQRYDRCLKLGSKLLPGDIPVVDLTAGRGGDGPVWDEIGKAVGL